MGRRTGKHTTHTHVYGGSECSTITEGSTGLLPLHDLRMVPEFSYLYVCVSHPLEEVDLRWGGSPPYPVPFTREMNQALISKADKRIKKLPPRYHPLTCNDSIVLWVCRLMLCVGDLVCRSFLPKSLSKVQARYLEPARRPMTPSEYEQAQQAERQRAEKGGSKRATGGGRAGGDEGEGRFAVASMQDPFGLGESRDEKKEEAEGGKDAATVKTKVRRGGVVGIGVTERKGLSESDSLAWLDVEGKSWLMGFAACGRCV